MALPLEQFVKQIEASGVLPSETLADFVPPKASPKDAAELARELVRQKKLTKFQAEQLSQGKGKSLVLGNYVLLDKIGQGGMGAVYKAQHRRMKRIVALKMLPPSMLKDPAAAARFQREVEAAAKLRHPNIVAADDADEASGVHFLAMEFVEGQDLSALVKTSGPLPVAKAVNCILQAARGLDFAHKKGVIHRDIKPANLLLDASGTVKILDMGLARIESGADAGTQAELTGTGMVMGTVDYMAPEQALSTRNADARADIYSLGLSLYYLIAGKPAYDGETLMAKLLAHRDHPIPALQDAQARVPKPLEEVFRNMVAKKIEDRYQHMSVVVEALEGLGLGGSVTGSMEARATALTLSSKERQLLASKGTKKPLGALTEVVSSERTKHLFAKIIGGAFATIIAPILVTFLIKCLERGESPPVTGTAVPPVTTTSPAAASTETPSDRRTTRQSASESTKIPEKASTGRQETPIAGDWLELIPLIEPAKDKFDLPNHTGANSWQVRDGELQFIPDSKPGKLLFPVRFLGRFYEFEMEVTCLSANANLNTDILARTGTLALNWETAGKGTVLLGQSVHGANLRVEQGQRIKLLLRVTPAGKHDRIEVIANGTSLLDWSGDRETLTVNLNEGYNSSERTGVYVRPNMRLLYHRLRFRMLDGTLEKIRP